MRQTRFVLFIALLLSVLSCREFDEKIVEEGNPVFLSADTKFKSSTQLGNFVTTAVRRALDLDIVLLPVDYFNPADVAYIHPNMSDYEIEKVVDIFPKGILDQLQLGTMKGKHLKEFVIERAREAYRLDVETAGIHYAVHFVGGFPQANFLMDGRYAINDDEYYRIAISDEYYFGSAFPGYKYRNNFNFHFRRRKYQESIRDSIRKYLKMGILYPWWDEVRAVVRNIDGGDAGFRTIPEIQGTSHTSPLISKRVVTEGIVTAVGTDRWYPFGNDVYIQTETPDNDVRTSEAIHVYVPSYNYNLKLGDKIRVAGTVYEDVRRNGMGQTSLQLISSLEIISRGNSLPAPTILGDGGRKIPTDRISTHGAELMQKPEFKLRAPNAFQYEGISCTDYDFQCDGIDFWESLEGMRIQVRDLTVVGFRGGEEDLIQITDRFYLNLYVIAEGQHSEGYRTQNGGLMLDFLKEDHNPEVMVITTNHLTNARGLDPQKVYNIGDEIKGTVTGNLIYQKNVFGGGEYAIVLPEIQEAFTRRDHRDSVTPVAERGETKLVSTADNEVTVATYNLENLSGHQDDRIKVMAESMAINLQCPDIINLVEIQDNNGISLRGTQDATMTLRKLMGQLQSLCTHRDYTFINIDPFLNAEGGQPGGNIRDSMIFNAKKLSYESRNDGSVGSQAIIQTGGILSSNPGRVFPNDPAFERSRRSLVTEFDLKSNPGQKIYVIGNHLNSKLGDIDFWGNLQPARPNSDFRRSRMAAKINEFILILEKLNPSAGIVVLGDFNALAEEGSLSALSNRERTLKNMIFTLPFNQRYTTNHNGNSQPLDYIFVNNYLFDKNAEAEVMNINSDYMGRLSDHDPVVLKVVF